jgi:MarR family transcriptional regulator, organic hydroperoxide resistance regulator
MTTRSPGEAKTIAQALSMPDQDISQYLSYLLASANRSMRIGLSNSISDEEFTEEHWRILQVLADEQGRSMGDLAERVLLNGPALTKSIDKLVSRGVVQRAADETDSRRVLVFISDLGLEVVARLTERVDAHHETIEVALGPRKTSQLKKLLESFIAESRAN